MTEPSNRDSWPLLEGIERAMQLAFADAILDHSRTGEPLVMWRDGQVVHVPPEELIDFAREVLAQPLPADPRKNAG